MVRRSFNSRRKGKTDWERVDKLTDEEIEAAVASDPDAPPLLDDEFWKNAQWVFPEVPRKARPISLRLDQEVLDYFRRLGRGYQTRINAVLRAHVRSQRQPVSRPAR
jgi:uncharacterized protein (DUF4415 family)